MYIVALAANGAFPKTICKYRDSRTHTHTHACTHTCAHTHNVLPEQSKVTPSDSLSQFIVSLQRLAQAWLGEVLVLRDLTQQQANQNQPLADCHSEA